MFSIKEKQPISKVVVHEEIDYLNYTYHNSTNQNMPAVAQIVSTGPLIDSQKEYKLCIETAGLNLQNVPVFEKSQLENCYLTIEKRNTPATKSTQQLSVHFTRQNNINDKGYSIEHFMKCFNKALSTALTAVGATATCRGYIRLNQSDSAYDLLMTNEMLDNATGYRIKMNDSLYAMCGAGFDTQYTRGNTNQEYEILFEPLFSKGTTTLLTYTYQIHTQAFSTITNLFFYDELLLTLSNISTKNEKTGTFNSNTRTLSVLTSYKLSNVNFKQNLDIMPAHYRYINVLNGSQVNSSSIKAYIRSKKGDIEELTIAPGQTLNIRVKIVEQ